MNSSVIAIPSREGEDVTRDTGKDTDEREGGESCGLRPGDAADLLFVLDDKDFRDREADLRRSEAEGGLDPLWKGLSSEKGLVPASSDSRFNLASGSSIFTAGSRAAGAGALLRGRRTVDLGSSGSVCSVSDARGVLVVLRLVGVFVLLAVDGVRETGSPTARSDLLFLLRGVFGAGGGGISCLSSSSSPDMVPSWLLGISVMPLLVRRTLACALSSLSLLGRSSVSMISKSWPFFAEEG